jgi:TetR/AcrR family transcriptional repressor of mexJK operon
MKGAAVTSTEEAIPAKRRQILGGARQVFGELGYERASVDLIATRAGVSKATVYNHFQDKRALFVASVVEECDALRAGLQRCLAKPAGELEPSLQRMGEQIMAVYLSPVVAGLFRHTIAEVARFPDIGRIVFERGRLQLQEAIAAYLARWHERGVLRIDDPAAAAVQFVALCQGDLGARSRLGMLQYPVDEEVRASVSRAVRTFVRAYRAEP